MGFNNEFSTDLSPIIVDIETAGLPNAAEFLEPIPDAVLDESHIVADKRLKDLVKIEEDLTRKVAARDARNVAAVAKVEQQRSARTEKLALDWNVGRIVAIGWWTEQGETYHFCMNEGGERLALGAFWHHCKHRTIVGFNVKG